jgi:hypothetical protein
MDRATRRSADGRWPVDNGTRVFDAAIHQVSASTTGSNSAPSQSTPPIGHLLEAEELTVLTAWAEAVAEAVAHNPKRAATIVADARPGAPRRETLGLAEPSKDVGEAINRMDRIVGAISPPDRTTRFTMASALPEDRPGETDLDGLVRRVLLAMVEQRATRQPEQAQHQ